MKNKLLNFTICQIFVVIGMSVSYVHCEEQKTPLAAENVTLYDRSFQKVLSRRKRFLLWRPGSNVLLTASLVKPLAFQRPGGHNLVLEWDIFYPLPNSWYKPTKPTKAAPDTTTPAPEVIETWDPHSDHQHSDHPGEIWMPSGGWSPESNVIKTLSEAEAEDKAERRDWTRVEQIRQTDFNNNKFFPSVTQYQNPLLFNKARQQMPQTNSNSDGKINFNQQYYQSNRRQSPSSSSSYSEKNFMGDNKQRRMSFMPKGRSLELGENKNEEMHSGQEESTDANWKHHQAHRERRDLYNQIETTSPLTSIDVKSCLLRTVCETQHFLLPPGYSLLQDMLRVIFTVPIRDDMNDDYSSAMRANDQDCASVYSEKCPMSILAFLLQSKL